MIIPPRNEPDPDRDFSDLDVWLVWALLAVCVVLLVIIWIWP
jgi:hypothetical protein